MRLITLTFLIFFLSCDQKEEEEAPKEASSPEMTEVSDAEEESSEIKEAGKSFVKLKGEVTYSLDNGEELQRQFPDTFEIPDKKVRENLKKGDIVKLVFIIKGKTNSQTERMWVAIDKINPDGYTGTLDNDPYCTDKIKSGLKVKFTPKHVISVYE